MEKKSFRQVSASSRTGFEKAQDAIRKHNKEYAIELLKTVIGMEPAFIDARELIRKLEKEKAENLGGMAKMSADLKIMFLVMKGRSKINKAPLEAMKVAEDALALNLYNNQALSLLADAAVEAKAVFVAVEALEIINEKSPNDISNLKRMADVYKAAGMGRDVLRVCQIIAQLKPGDLEAEQGVRQAAAFASMSDDWKGDGDFTEKVNTDGGGQVQEKMEHAARNIDDIAERIQHFESKIEAGEDSIDARRKLGELFYRAGRFDDSVDSYNKATEMIGSLDPTIDKAIEKANVGKLQAYIEQLRSDGQEDQIPAIEKQIYDYRYERASERVTKYPNDTEMRFQYAIVLWDGGQVDDALEQFQNAQRNPHRRLTCYVYMARCFHKKGQFDMAVEQMQKAVSEMLVMDKEKMNAVYHLGLIYEDMGEGEKAVQCFKDIYQTNVNYRDVNDRIQSSYST